MRTEKILFQAVSDHDNYCDGVISSNSPNYITGIILDIGLVKSKYNHQGSMLLDKILAFDRAESAKTNLGQINMITVSSFCGPGGLMWGLDIAKHPDIEKDMPVKYIAGSGKEIPIYSAGPLKEAMLRLFGTVEDKRFPLMPGSLVPCAGKSIEMKGPKHIYAALAFGVAENRGTDACLFMEDVGIIHNFTQGGKKKMKEKITDHMARSILEVGKNQKVAYEKIFVDIVDCEIKKNEIGCALVAAPYFKLAKKAIADNDFGKMRSVSLDEWEELSKSFFIGKKL